VTGTIHYYAKDDKAKGLYRLSMQFTLGTLNATASYQEQN
jgi:hypothetical protein